MAITTVSWNVTPKKTTRMVISTYNCNCTPKIQVSSRLILVMMLLFVVHCSHLPCCFTVGWPTQVGSLPKDPSSQDVGFFLPRGRASLRVWHVELLNRCTRSGYPKDGGTCSTRDFLFSSAIEPLVSQNKQQLSINCIVLGSQIQND